MDEFEVDEFEVGGKYRGFPEEIGLQNEFY